MKTVHVKPLFSEYRIAQIVTNSVDRYQYMNNVEWDEIHNFKIKDERWFSTLKLWKILFAPIK